MIHLKRLNFRHFASVIAFFLFALVFSSAAFADEEGIFTYTVKDGAATITAVDFEGQEEFYIPDTLGGYPVKALGRDLFSGDFEFGNEDMIGTVYVPASVESMYNDTFDFGDIARIIVDENNPNFSSDSHGVLFNKDKTRLIYCPCSLQETEYTVPDTVTEIGAYSFQTSVFLEKINLPENLTTIEWQAFMQCISLKEIDIPDGVTVIDQNCFARCYSLEKVKLPANLIKIRNSSFTECESLKKIRIPEGTQTVESYAFADDIALETLMLPTTLESFETSALYDCPELKYVLCAGGETGLEKSIKTADFHYYFNADDYDTLDYIEDENILYIDGEGSTPSDNEKTWHFWDDFSDKITTIIIGGDIDTIGSYSFTDFPELANVIIETPDIEIEKNAFSGCPLLENIIMFGNSNFSTESFVDCADSIRVYEDKNSTHTFSLSSTRINVVGFTFEDNTLKFSGGLELDSYEFFDTVAAFCIKYDNITKVSFESLRFENIAIYYYDTDGSTKRLEENTLTNGDISIRMNVDGEDKIISYNELIEKISTEPTVKFFLVTGDEKHEEIVETQVSIIEEIVRRILQALKWAVTLVSKLFKVITKK